MCRACQAWISTSQPLAAAANTVVFAQGNVGVSLASSPQREPAIPAEAAAVHVASFEQGTAQAGHRTGPDAHAQCGSTQDSAEASAGPGPQQGHESAAGAGPHWGNVVPQNQNDELNRHLAVAGQRAQQEPVATAAAGCQGQESAAGQAEPGRPAGQQPTAAELQGWEPVSGQAEPGRPASAKGRTKPLKANPTLQQPGTEMETSAAGGATFSAQQSAAEASWPSLSSDEALLQQQHSLPQQHADLSVSAAAQADPDMVQQPAAELEALAPPKNLFGQAPIGRNTAKQAGGPQKWLTPIMHELAVPEGTTSEDLQLQQLRMLGMQGEAPVAHRQTLEEQHVPSAWAAGSAPASHRQQSEGATEAPKTSAWSPQQQHKQRAAESGQHPPGKPLSSEQPQVGGSKSSQQAEAESPAVLQPAAAPAGPVSWAQRLQNSGPAQPPKLKLGPATPSRISVSGPATPPTPAGMQTTGKQTQRNGRATTSAGQKVRAGAADEECTRLRSPGGHALCAPGVFLAFSDASVVLHGASGELTLCAV